MGENFGKNVLMFVINNEELKSKVDIISYFKIYSRFGKLLSAKCIWRITYFFWVYWWSDWLQRWFSVILKLCARARLHYFYWAHIFFFVTSSRLLWLSSQLTLCPHDMLCLVSRQALWYLRLFVSSVWYLSMNWL